MNYEQFAMWLQGFFEISSAKTLNEKQTQIIKDHLALLFQKVTPDREKTTSFNKDTWEELKKAAEKAEQDRKGSKWPNTAPFPYKPYYLDSPKINPDKIVCGIDAGSVLPDTENSVCIANKCNEIALGEQFKGVNMKFDTNLHESKTYC